jgi:hypothetical protein
MLTVAKIGSVSTAKAMTQVVFVPANSEAPVWVSSWLPTDWVNSQVRPGVQIVAEHIVFGRVETSYEKDGIVIALKAPKQTVTLRGAISVVVPESLPEAQFTVSEQASAYASNWDSKREATVVAQFGDDTPL